MQPYTAAYTSCCDRSLRRAACAGRRAIAFHRSAVAMPLTSARLCASVLPPLFAAGAQEHTATPVETS